MQEKIEEIKGEKQSILILDDLDRIDPEHIFRILNIFSAHFDLYNNEQSNKFGFDKIILVADYRNIKSIFHHKYGSETDFNGYFDKFFSVEVFDFNNEEIIKEFIDEIISEFKKENSKSLQKMLDNEGYLKFFLKEILLRSSAFSGKEKLNLRQLLKGIKFPLPIFNSGLYSKSHFYNSDNVITFIINIGIKSLISIFGAGEKDFLSILQKIRLNLKLNIHETNHEDFETILFSLLGKFTSYNVNKGNQSIGWKNYSISVILGNEIKKIVDKNSGDEFTKIFLFYDLLIEYVENKYYAQNVRFK